MRISLARSIPLLVMALATLSYAMTTAFESSQVAIVVHSNMYVVNAIPTRWGAELCLVSPSGVGIARVKPINGSIDSLTVGLAKGFGLVSCRVFPWGALAVVERSSVRVTPTTFVMPRAPGRYIRITASGSIVTTSAIIVMNESSARWVEYVVKGVRLFDADELEGRIVAVGMDSGGHVIALLIEGSSVKALNLSVEATRCLEVKAVGSSIEAVCVSQAGTEVMELRGDRVRILEIPLLKAYRSYVSREAAYLASGFTIAILEPNATAKLVELRRGNVVYLGDGTALAYLKGLGDVVIDLRELRAYMITGTICSEAQVLGQGRVFALCSSTILFLNPGSKVELYGYTIGLAKTKLNASISVEKVRKLETIARRARGIGVSIRFLEPKRSTVTLNSFVARIPTETTSKAVLGNGALIWVAIAVAVAGSVAIAIATRRVVRKS